MLSSITLKDGHEEKMNIFYSNHRDILDSDKFLHRYFAKTLQTYNFFDCLNSC